jgi:GAF domain-containing protein
MAEELIITAGSKEGRYRELLPQIKSLLEGEDDLVANLANLAAALKTAMGFFWVGFYLVKDNELVLGPFQGPVACTRIAQGKGVCGAAWAQKKTLVVADVEKFPGHIACSALSKSEIVVPFTGADGEVRGVLDVDSEALNDFDETDKKYLQEIAGLIKIN